MDKAFIFLVITIFSYSLNAHDDIPLFNQVNLQAQSERDIPNDQLIVILAAEAEGKDPSKIVDKINQDMDWALNRVKKNNDIKSRTFSYNTHPIYDKHTVIGWYANQRLELKSSNITNLSKFVGDLQERLQIKSTNFGPTSKTRDHYENELIEEAMVAFKKRVTVVKKYMDKKNVRIVNVHVDINNGHPISVYAEKKAMSMNNKSALAVEAGTSKITVTIYGSVQFF